MLRDSSPVNYVACPTKIIEYLKYGIIPILKSTEIGDFVDLGMEYITYTDLMKGLTISHKKRNMMQEKNYEILDKLVQTSKTGLNNLENLLEV